jgi:hypothetical protein
MSGSTPDRLHVFLGVHDFGQDPAVVTTIMGIEPIAAWAKGDPIPNHPTARRLFSRWALESRLSIGSPIEEHLIALLEQLEPRREAVDQVVRQFDAGLQIAAYFHQTNPGLHIDHPLLARISALGLSIDFDIYCLATERP